MMNTLVENQVQAGRFIDETGIDRLAVPASRRDACAEEMRTGQFLAWQRRLSRPHRKRGRRSLCANLVRVYPSIAGGLVARQIDILFDQVSSSLPQLRAGKIKAFAAGSRLTVALEISVEEAGLPGFLRVPNGTPSSVIKRLNAAVVDPLAHARCGLVISAPSAHCPGSERRRHARARKRAKNREVVADYQGRRYRGDHA
jgi:hypothetical protein